MTLLTLCGVERVFPGSPPVAALRGIDLAVQQGEFLTITGTSGSGKSTLLNILGLLDRPSAGTYHLDGVDVTGLGDRDRAAIRGSWIGFVFQSFHLLAGRSAVENVALTGLYSAVKRKVRLAAAREMLIRLGLGHRLTATPASMSGGECQRVALARAMLANPRVLLCDEPTGALDSASTENVLAAIDTLSQGGMTIVLITHDQRVADRGGRTLTIEDGALS